MLFTTLLIVFLSMGECGGEPHTRYNSFTQRKLTFDPLAAPPAIKPDVGIDAKVGVKEIQEDVEMMKRVLRNHDTQRQLNALLQIKHTSNAKEGGAGKAFTFVDKSKSTEELIDPAVQRYFSLGNIRSNGWFANGITHGGLFDDWDISMDDVAPNTNILVATTVVDDEDTTD
jgi:hypothetical protein